MYEIEEFYAEDGSNLKEILKSCIYNYYMKNKDKILSSNDLPNKKNHRIMDTTNKYEILSKKGENNVQTVQ
mgnify:CR=1 FL=1